MAALALGLLASACTVQPVYMPIAQGPNVAADLSAIAIEEVSTRVAQQVRNNLIFGFTGGGVAAPARYDLALRVVSREARLGFERDETAPAYSVTITVSYELKEIATGKIILRSLNRGVASYDRSNQAFANQRARIDAEDRAAQSVADDIQLRLASALASGKRN
jgi:LPS-assembly lipoprotein